jgi:ribonuclease D
MNIDIKVHKDDLPEDLDLGNSVAVDGEFMGLDVKRDPLCLVQISSGKLDAHLIKLLSNKKIIKIFHYARADMAHIKHYLKTDVENVKCTKLSSKLARTFSDRHGLKDLIKEIIGIDISKQKQSSDFGGELTSAQLKYCANDVIYLHKIHDELNKILVRENREFLYIDCLKFLKTRVELDLAAFKDDIWSH